MEDDASKIRRAAPVRGPKHSVIRHRETGEMTPAVRWPDPVRPLEQPITRPGKPLKPIQFPMDEDPGYGRGELDDPGFRRAQSGDHDYGRGEPGYHGYGRGEPDDHGFRPAVPEEFDFRRSAEREAYDNVTNNDNGLDRLSPVAKSNSKFRFGNEDGFDIGPDIPDMDADSPDIDSAKETVV